MRIYRAGLPTQYVDEPEPESETNIAPLAPLVAPMVVGDDAIHQANVAHLSKLAHTLGQAPPQIIPMVAPKPLVNGDA